MSVSKFIITTGDISDFDGFLALPLYRKAAAKTGGCDVVFIMNYPAYMQDIVPITGGKKNKRTKLRGGDDAAFDAIVKKLDANTPLTPEDNAVLKEHKRNKPGLGYYYTSHELFQIQRLNEDAQKYQDMYPSLNKKDLMKQLAYDMCVAVWKDCEDLGPSVNLIFVDGGINEVNPFSINTIKNEFNVYCKYFLGDSHSATGGPIPSLSLEVFCGMAATRDVYMDMNGSMAFYNDDFSMLMNSQVKCVSIMGGVLATKAMDTMSTMSFLNRFGTATMNQLYSKTKTGRFLDDVKNKKIPCYVVSNNEINAKFTYKINNSFDDSLVLYRSKLQSMGLLKTSGVALDLFNAFYTAKNAGANIVPLPYKPFDVLSAYALVDVMQQTGGHKQTNAKLRYRAEYGSTIIVDNDVVNVDLTTPVILKRGIIIGTMPDSVAVKKEILDGIKNELQVMIGSCDDTLPKSYDDYAILDIINCTYKDQAEIEGLITSFMSSMGGGATKVKVYGRLRNIHVIKRCKYVKYNGTLVKLSELQKRERAAQKQRSKH